jgi:predicted phage-related endonuclease
MSEFQLPANASWYNKEKGVYRSVIKPWTDAWYQERLSGIGGSDAGRVLGLSDWEGASCLELFYEKIGLKPQQRQSNKFTFMGNYLEQTVADLWRYHDGSDIGFITNYEAGNRLRECRNVNGFLRNTKYPHLYVNIDRLIQKGAFKLTDATILEDNGILECKTASSWVARKWEAGVPPIYTMQVVQQCLVVEVEYAEIAILELDNRSLSVYPIEPTPELKNSLVENTLYFWEEMVLPAKKLVAEMNYEINRGNISASEKLMAEIEKLEPSADASESYKSFMNKRWLSEPVIIKADDKLINEICNLTLVKQVIKTLDSEQTFFENQVREFMRENDTLDCGDFGKVTWKTGAKARTMLTRGFKHDPTDQVNDIVSKIKAKYL